jgi:hypothetical protein
MLMLMRAAALLALSLVACVDDPDVSESRSSVVTDNRLVANQLAQNRLVANQLAANKLASSKISDSTLALDSALASDILSTAGGREVLQFIVSCAIDPGVVLVGEYAGTTYTFEGDLGLANTWLYAPLTRTGKGWVSACLFARVNVASLAVPISLRGNNPNLAATDEEKETFTLQEGAFYGNFFTPDDEPIDWNACRGSDQAAPGGEVGGLILRDCAEPDPAHPGLTYCGFNYAGDCGDFADRYACKQYDDNGTFYRHCQDNPAYRNKNTNHGFGHSGDNNAYGQIITTYVLAPVVIGP